MQKSFRMFISFVSCAALFSACQSAQPASESASTEIAVSAPAQAVVASELILPQELISKVEAESILGESAIDCTPSENAVVGQSLCFYDAADEDSWRFLQIGVSQQANIPAENGTTPQSIYDTTKEAFGEDAVMIDGIGDEAMRVTGGYYIMSDGYLLQISAGNTGDESVLAILDQAGKLAIANLKSILAK